MKQTSIYIILIALLVASCVGDKQSFSISGEFKGIKQGEFMCFSQSAEWGTLDTIKIQNGEFEFTHPLADTCIIYLQYPNFLQTQIIAIPGESVSLSGDANNILAVKVSGDEHNEALSEFRHSTQALKGDALTKAAEQFILAHPESWASVAVFDEYFLQVEHPDYNKVRTLLEAMLKIRPERKALLAYNLQLSAIAQCQPGNKLPRFNATTIYGQSVNNDNFKGRAMLISFWSTADNNFIYPVVTQRHLMKRLGGRIEQLNICLDADTAACSRIIRTDSIRGYNICDLQTFNSPLVSLFGLKQLPANILVDSTGVILERDIAPTELEATLSKHNIH